LSAPLESIEMSLDFNPKINTKTDFKRIVKQLLMF